MRMEIPLILQLRRREKSSSKVLQNDGGSGTIESTQSRRENSDGKEKQHISDRRRVRGVSESQSGTREKDGRGSRIQSEVGRTKEENPVHASRRPLGLNYDGSSTPFNVGDTVEISKDSEIYENQQRVIDEYGVDCYVIKSAVWELEGRDEPAGAYKGKVYVSEDIDPELVTTLAPHEGSHIMKHLKFQPYLDFTDKVADMIDRSKIETQKLFEIISEHIGVDVMGDMDPGRFYDEMNASIYGFYKSGMMESTCFSELVYEAFYDFEAYITELDAIHEQYKQEVKEKRASPQPTKENTIEPERVVYSSKTAKAYDAIPRDKLSKEQKKELKRERRSKNERAFGKPNALNLCTLFNCKHCLLSS